MTWKAIILESGYLLTEVPGGRIGKAVGHTLYQRQIKKALMYNARILDHWKYREKDDAIEALQSLRELVELSKK